MPTSDREDPPNHFPGCGGMGCGACTPDDPEDPPKPDARPTAAEVLQVIGGCMLRDDERSAVAVLNAYAQAAVRAAVEARDRERLKTDHHALGEWSKCPDCTRYFAQDQEGATLNAKLEADLSRLREENARTLACLSQTQQERDEALAITMFCEDCDHGIRAGQPCEMCGGTGYVKAEALRARVGELEAALRSIRDHEGLTSINGKDAKAIARRALAPQPPSEAPSLIVTHHEAHPDGTCNCPRLSVHAEEK